MSTERWKPSVTVAAVVERGGRYLLVEERTPEGLKLNNPAGHLDPGESPEQAAVRECLEETACAFVPQALLGVYLARFERPASAGAPAEDITYLRFAYTGTVGEPEPGRALDEPIERTLWLRPTRFTRSRTGCAARWCCAASPTTPPACGMRWARCGPTIHCNNHGAWPEDNDR
jgi:8-oxo-dGTP pyrophosphatase MutT (NUDIX family)